MVELKILLIALLIIVAINIWHTIQSENLFSRLLDDISSYSIKESIKLYLSEKEYTMVAMANGFYDGKVYRTQGIANYFGI